MNTKLDRDREARPVTGNLCEAVRSREAAAYYGEACTVDLYGYSHLSNAADDGGQDVLVLMHPRHHVDDGHLARIVPQEVPETQTQTPKIHSNNDNLGSQHEPSSTSAVSNLRAAIEAILGSTPTLPAEVEAVREERFAANGAGKFRGVTRHKRTLRFEAHIWESKKQIYLVRMKMGAPTHSHALNLSPTLPAHSFARVDLSPSFSPRGATTLWPSSARGTCTIWTICFLVRLLTCSLIRSFVCPSAHTCVLKLTRVSRLLVRQPRLGLPQLRKKRLLAGHRGSTSCGEGGYHLLPPRVLQNLWRPRR